MTIFRLGQQTEELALTTTEQSAGTMNNQPYNQRPGYYAPQYSYNYQQPYNPVPPYPASPYGMPTPMSNYAYYQPPMAAPPEMPPTFVPVNPPMYAPTVQYSQTRMASPSPYAYPAPPAYNYSTTNMIARPPRPMSIYPQLSQIHTYPPLATNASPSNSMSNNNGVNQTVVKTEPPRDIVESSRKLSEVSIAVSITFTILT